MPTTPLTFGDTVRVRATAETESIGLAGLTGSVYGETTPSVTDVEVIGEDPDDFAINVFFDDLDEAKWFAPDLLDFIDHGAGAEIEIDGVAGKFVRSDDGEWVERATDAAPGGSRPWWKFW